MAKNSRKIKPKQKRRFKRVGSGGKREGAGRPKSPLTPLKENFAAAALAYADKSELGEARAWRVFLKGRSKQLAFDARKFLTTMRNGTPRQTSEISHTGDVTIEFAPKEGATGAPPWARSNPKSLRDEIAADGARAETAKPQS
jgi:hypothetical protein